MKESENFLSPSMASSARNPNSTPALARSRSVVSRSVVSLPICSVPVCSVFLGLLFCLLSASSGVETTAAQTPAQVPAQDGTAGDQALSQPVAPVSSSLNTLLDQARAGTASIDEVAHAFVENSLKGEKIPFQLSSLSGELPGIEDVLAPVVQKALDEQLPQRKTADLKSFQELLVVLPADALERAKKAFALCEQADGLVESGNAAALQALAAKTELPFKRFLELRIKSLDLLTQAGLANTSPSQGLVLLSQIPPCGRTQKTREATLGLLEKLNGPATPEADEVFGAIAVQQAIKEALHMAPQKKDDIIALYEKQVRSMIERASSDHLLDCFRMLIELRPDPNPQNTEMRMFAATHTKTEGLKYFAVARLDEMRSAGELSLWKKLRLIFGGYYGTFLPILVTILIIFFGCGGAAFVFFYFQFRRKESALYAEEQEFQKEASESFSTYKSNQRRAQQEAGQRSKKATGGSFGGRKPRGYVNPLHGEDEYSRLLSLFGLTDSATETEIKKAYRDTVKNYHPDTANQGGGGGNSEEDRTKFFIQAKETYDRILEIRSSWFGTKK